MSTSPLQARISLSTLLRTMWRSPTFTIARFMLRSYIRSGWLLGDLAFIWLLYAVFFFEFGGNVAYFYGTIDQPLSLLAVLSTIVITQRAMTARMYLPLARLTSRSAYIQGILLATTFLRLLSFLLILLLAMGYHHHTPNFGIEGATLANMLPGTIGLLLNSICVSALTVVLYRPIATRLLQIIFLVWCVASLYANTNTNVVAQYLVLTHLPLTPISICYSLGTSDSFDIYSLGMILLVIAYIIALALLAHFLLNKRDLILQ